eukprot:376595-Alexandrium_andersonii.AAC.1
MRCANGNRPRADGRRTGSRCSAPLSPSPDPQLADTASTANPGVRPAAIHVAEEGVDLLAGLEAGVEEHSKLR